VPILASPPWLPLALRPCAAQAGAGRGRGTGSSAAHMARYNVTVMTMAMDIEAPAGGRKGLPYMETIAQRGLIPLHVPHTVSLPSSPCMCCTHRPCLAPTHACGSFWLPLCLANAAAQALPPHFCP